MILPNSLELLRSGLRGVYTVVEVRDGSVKEPFAEVISSILREFLFERPDSLLTEISRDAAAATIAHVVAYDLVFSMPTDALPIADECADDFIILFPDSTRFYSNSGDPLWGERQSWAPITSWTFDAGILAISPSRYGVLWCADED